MAHLCKRSNDARALPEFLINRCEASSYFFFSFFLLPFYLFFLLRSLIKREPIDLLLVFLLLGMVILLTWELFGLPPFLAKPLLLNNVPANRTMFSLGIINLVLIVYYVTRLKNDKTQAYKIVAALYSIAVFMIVFLLGRYIKMTWPDFLGSDLKILLIAGTVGLIMALVLYQKGLAAFSLFLAFSLVSTFSVNPLYHGLSPLRDPFVTKAIADIKTKDPDAGWVIYDGLILGNYLASNGVRVLNGTQLYPNLSFWAQLDPQHKYVDIYNRYAYVNVKSSMDPAKVEFESPHFSTVTLNISPCNARLYDMGVRYHVFAHPRPEFSCLSLVQKTKFPSWSIYIYKQVQ